MKKFIFLILASILSAACSSFTLSVEPAIELVAYNSLTEKELKRIQVSPKDSVVTEEKISAEMASLIDPDYEEQKVYAVLFNDTAIEGSGNLLVFVSLDKKNVVGKATAALN